MSALVIHPAFHSPIAFTVAIHAKDFIKAEYITEKSFLTNREKQLIKRICLEVC